MGERTVAVRISQTLFDLLAIGTRMAVTRAFTVELSWWSDLDGNVLGTVILDKTDQDYGWVILTKDSARRFRGSDVESSIASERVATARLRLAIAAKARDPSFAGFEAQGDEPTSVLDLFQDRGVSDNKLHPYYRLLRDMPTRSPARRVFQAISPWLVTSDSHLVKEFQEAQFDQRLWEIYLWAMFRDQGYDVEHREAPDLIVTDPLLGSFAVEATTVAPSKTGPLADHPNPKTPEEIQFFLADYMPLKFGSSLTSKLNKVDAEGRHYWQKPGCEDLPFVLAIADFHKAGDPAENQALGSMTYSQGGLYTYLYGIRVYVEEVNGRKIILQSPVPTHEFNGKTAPSGFFQLPLSENVSAVLFTNAATLAKFDRMGVLAGYAPPGTRYLRVGQRFDPDPGALVGIPFSVEVGAEGYEEHWGDEVQVLHNPRALRPISPDAFPDAAHFLVENGVLTSFDIGGRVLSSMTLIFTATSSETEGLEPRP